MQGNRLPLAKFSLLTERIWLLEKTGAATQFVVVGGDGEILRLWLVRYGSLIRGVRFYYLSDEGQLDELDPPAG